MTFVKAYIGETPIFQGSSVGAKILKTGQTVSYTTGDDGDIEAGRAVDFFTLATSNPFGNTNRFTALDGSQTYTNNIVIDWTTYDGSTALGWRRTDNGVNIAWINAISGASATSIGSYTSGWRLPNINELLSLVRFGSGTTSFLDFAPFNLTARFIWSSTTTPDDSLSTFRLDNLIGSNIYIGRSVKTLSTSFRYIPCRNFTVTGTTLT
jgi:hypothetical protein